MGDFTISGFRPDAAASSGTASSYSTVTLPQAQTMDSGFHVHTHRPHAAFHEVAALPRFEPETLQPALPIEWIILLPVAAIVVAHIASRRGSRFTAARGVL